VACRLELFVLWFRRRWWFFAQAGLFGVSFCPFGDVSPLRGSDPFLLFGVILVSNLILSGFVFLTLSGLIFFALSPILLSFRALLLGVLLNGLSTSSFIVALPTIVLEGEGYVFAALGGVILGLSWLRPKWVYNGEEDL
jgi:hypothetical protein